MSVLSLTFHTTAAIEQEWNSYAQKELEELVNNLWDVEKYMLSTVESEMLSEGSNTNVLLVFASPQKRMEFMESELQNITERILDRFGEEVLVFKTLLNPLSSPL